MRHPLAAVALMLGLLIPCAALAQQNPPEPILRMAIDPPRVVVGQAATLRIDLLAPNYMTAPPELPDFQVRNAVTRQLRSVNENEQRDGVSYAGVRFEFAIHPQEPGSYAIAGQAITIKYAAEPPAPACARPRSRCRRSHLRPSSRTRPPPCSRSWPRAIYRSSRPSTDRRISSRPGMP